MRRSLPAFAVLLAALLVAATLIAVTGRSLPAVVGRRESPRRSSSVISSSVIMR